MNKYLKVVLFFYYFYIPFLTSYLYSFKGNVNVLPEFKNNMFYFGNVIFYALY